SIAASHPAGFTMSRSSSDGAIAGWRRTSSIRYIRRPEVGLGAPRTNGRQRAASATLSARLVRQVTLAADPQGEIAPRSDGHSLPLGNFGAPPAACARALAAGVPLGLLSSDRRRIEKYPGPLIRGLARIGMLEYYLERAGIGQVVIEAQVPDYWPRI